MEPSTILETKRLVLREFTLDDAPLILKLVNTPTWLKFIGDRNIHTIEDAKNYLISGPMDSYKKNGFGLSAVLLKDNTLIGMCGLVKRDTLDDIDIGFALLPEYFGKGYAYEIAAATMHHAKSVLKIDRVVAITDVNNASSINLLEKIGLRFEKKITLAINDSAMLFTPKK